MSWNWDELQEKRDRQRKNTPPTDPKQDNPFGKVRLNRLPQGSFKNGIPLISILIVVVLGWLASGIFIVNPGQEAVVLRFGKYMYTVDDGPHYRFPVPIESHITIDTEKLRTLTIGLSEAEAAAATAEQRRLAGTFTGDENIIHLHFNVQYTIDDAAAFLFRVKNPPELIRSATDAVMRELIGSMNVEDIIPNRKHIESQVLLKTRKLLNDYELGVNLHAVQLGDVYPPAEVKEAFFNVASAREAKATIENQALAYRAAVIPVANGTARSIVNAARAYNATVMQNAEGEAQRFLLMAEQYKKAPKATTTRLYLNTMHTILAAPHLEKVILSKRNSGVLQHLDIGVPFLAPTKTAPETSQPKPSSPTSGQPRIHQGSER